MMKLFNSIMKHSQWASQLSYVDTVNITSPRNDQQSHTLHATKILGF